MTTKAATPVQSGVITEPPVQLCRTIERHLTRLRDSAEPIRTQLDRRTTEATALSAIQTEQHDQQCFDLSIEANHLATTIGRVRRPVPEAHQGRDCSTMEPAPRQRIGVANDASWFLDGGNTTTHPPPEMS